MKYVEISLELFLEIYTHLTLNSSDSDEISPSSPERVANRLLNTMKNEILNDFGKNLDKLLNK